MQSWREENKYPGRSDKSVNPHPKWDLNKIAVIFNAKEQQVLLISENLNLSTDVMQCIQASTAKELLALKSAR
ncbi:hypothetical protein [Pantoea ananatis]|uniref:hypothetical protein n=1 Tax=Pantoea ananas TaxID=553 RepID=UPI00130338F5|nr:hypothetical protein [Pantoea ananatis]